eukprot:TRINITY_DN19129_c0_g1_i1.p1 TRINITY_DN19129_c0_g1~~TRINITY_DN19129_c0_g1_i1.p1  ORF type:complete len:391 (+),score=104.16 TRINITY_DN19129_c0_g1_i1:32-1174(+)
MSLCRAALVAALGLAVYVEGYPAAPVFNGVYNDTMQGHFQFGKDMGSRFNAQIQKRYASETGLIRVEQWVKAGGGQHVYDTFLQNHQREYPEYVEELKGIAEGSQMPFESVFMMNLIQEFELYAPQNASRATTDQCSDYIVRNGDHVFVVHNEDSGGSDLEHTFIANVSFTTTKWVALVYMGDLPTGAFGYNSGNVAFTLNKVPPSEGYMGGFGRGFVSRELLTATTYDKAFEIVTGRPMIAGHNYQLMDIKSKRTVDIETYHTEYKQKEVAAGDPPHFHANTYILGDWPQLTDWGSIARDVRAAQLPPPTNLQEALAVLGDQYNASYPIFHGPPDARNGDVTGLYTLTTAYFDLSNFTITLYTGNPKQLDVVFFGSLLD